MATRTKPPTKRYFTVSEANRTLPLIQAIVKDVTVLAHDLQQRGDRLAQVKPPARGGFDEAHHEELRQAFADLERDQERMAEYEQELRDLGVELKDYFQGLIDFPSRRDGRDVYLCWRLGEPTVQFWHELDGGFAGRQKLKDEEHARLRTSGERILDNPVN